MFKMNLKSKQKDTVEDSHNSFLTVQNIDSCKNSYLKVKDGEKPVKEFEKLILNDVFKECHDLYELPLINEYDFLKVLNNRYKLYDDGKFHLPIELYRFKFYKAVDKYNNFNKAFNELFFMPSFLKDEILKLSLMENFLTVEANLTEKGHDYLKEYDWIDFYMNYLNYFDFSDFFNYFKNHKGNICEIARNYLSKHIVLAEDLFDYNYLIKSYKSIIEIDMLLKDLDDVLRYEIRIFILNMNPICLDISKYPFHNPINHDNIVNLKNLELNFGINSILDEFDLNWNFLHFKSHIIPKNVVKSFLIDLLNGDNVDNSEIIMSYFANI